MTLYTLEILYNWQAEAKPKYFFFSSFPVVRMGVQIGELIPRKEIELESLYGKKVAIDAFNAMYQFLSTIRQRDGTPLMDSQGRITSHLSGFFYRTINLMEAGIKPAYVFDGKPPDFKKREFEKRREAREEAEEKWYEALEKGDLEEAKKYAMRATRVNEELINDAKKLLELMGIPVVQAPSEEKLKRLTWPPKSCLCLCKPGLRLTPLRCAEARKEPHDNWEEKTSRKERLRRGQAGAGGSGRGS